MSTPTPPPSPNGKTRYEIRYFDEPGNNESFTQLPMPDEEAGQQYLDGLELLEEGILMDGTITPRFELVWIHADDPETKGTVAKREAPLNIEVPETLEGLDPVAAEQALNQVHQALFNWAYVTLGLPGNVRQDLHPTLGSFYLNMTASEAGSYRVKLDYAAPTSDGLNEVTLELGPLPYVEAIMAVKNALASLSQALNEQSSRAAVGETDLQVRVTDQGFIAA